ncbi:MAG: pantoate--beta-alanine ligase [Phycisphaerae bacterium]|nr:pantoate--beta-alanine ligase [Phycisphaerae bacterium]
MHDGHMALVRRARELSSDGTPVVVSIFVNPTQFGPREDFSRYPRTLEADLERCRSAGVDVVFAPPAEVVYPSDITVMAPPLPLVATEPGLEDRIRPGHFAGVCQVVSRLFDLLRPRWAVFGEKDYQQLRVIEAMTGNGAWGVRIAPVATVREPDGLAMSSRNRYLDTARRTRATALFAALARANEHDRPDAAEEVMRRTLAEWGLAVEYAVVRDAETLMPLTSEGVPSRRARSLLAARLGEIRLIDNAPWVGSRTPAGLD